jgi:RNA polymerase sigma factor (sigma-70 family)
LMETLSNDTEVNVEHTHDMCNVLERLNERQREVVRAVSLEGCSAQEAARRLQMSEGAVRVTLHRSLKVLAAMFRAVPNED